MPRQCITCQHKDVELINKAIVEGESKRDIAKRFQLSRSSVQRHSKNHLPTLLRKALKEKEGAHGKSLLEVLDEVESEVWNVIQKLDEKGDYRGEIRGFSELRRQFELKARLFGVEEAEDDFKIEDHPSWVELRTRILTILEPFPEVFQTLIAELEDDDVST
jgi:transposase